jgi:hypothetical protein
LTAAFCFAFKCTHGLAGVFDGSGKLNIPFGTARSCHVPDADHAIDPSVLRMCSAARTLYSGLWRLPPFAMSGWELAWTCNRPVAVEAL